MNRTRKAAALTLCLLLVSASQLGADVKADEKGLVRFEGTLGRVVNLFGGKAAREGIKSTVAVKGDRKATMNDAGGQIIDLNEEKIYDLDIRRKTYKVTTFAELRRRMEEAQRKAEEDARKEQAREKPPSLRSRRAIRTRKSWKWTSTSRRLARRRPSTASTRASSSRRSRCARKERPSRRAAGSC